MLKIMICYVNIAFFLQPTSSQYQYGSIQNQYESPYQNHYNYQPNVYARKEYENYHQVNYHQPKSRKRSRIGKYPDLGNDYINNGDSEECKCSCSNCNNPEPCCRNMCNINCSPQAIQTNFVYVPYPIAIMMKPKSDKKEITGSILTTSPTDPDHTKTSPNTLETAIMTISSEITASSNSERTTTDPETTSPKTTTHPETKSTVPPMINTATETTSDPITTDANDNMDTYRRWKNIRQNQKYLLVSLRNTIRPDDKSSYGIIAVPEKISNKFIPKLYGLSYPRRSTYRRNKFHVYNDLSDY